VSISPPITPGRGRRSRGAARRRWGRLRAGAVCALALALIAALIVVVVPSNSADHHSPRVAARPPQRHLAPAPRAPALSPTGLVLGKPPLTLIGGDAPRKDPVRAAFHPPPSAGMLFNLASGRVLWQRNSSTRLPIASLTKMMTALLAVRSGPPDARVLVTEQAVHAGGSKVGLLPLHRHVRFESMLYSLLLPSGNDAADALAQHVSGTISRFVAAMNVEAAKLGLGCTRFSSPSGYYDAGNESCAADLAVLAHVDLAQPRLARITRARSAILPFPIKGGKLYLYNNNPLLRYPYPGLTGLKTGWTIAAGRCLVATAERHGVRLGVVLLHSADPATQARQLLDRAFKGVYHQRLVPEPPLPPGA
jgi:serine-type D-Ala-D-Ala carboxypeptidase (penicillin-binding protein 5/6)